MGFPKTGLYEGFTRSHSDGRRWKYRAAKGVWQIKQEINSEDTKYKGRTQVTLALMEPMELLALMEPMELQELMAQPEQPAQQELQAQQGQVQSMHLNGCSQETHP